MNYQLNLLSTIAVIYLITAVLTWTSYVLINHIEVLEMEYYKIPLLVVGIISVVLVVFLIMMSLVIGMARYHLSPGYSLTLFIFIFACIAVMTTYSVFGFIDAITTDRGNLAANPRNIMTTYTASSLYTSVMGFIILVLLLGAIGYYIGLLLDNSNQKIKPFEETSHTSTSNITTDN